MNLPENFRKLVNGIMPEENNAIIYDTDPDGVCAAVITARALKQLGKKVSLKIGVRHTEETLSKELLIKLKKNQIRHTIICDLAADKSAERMNSLKKFSKVLILDHHKLYKDLNSEGVVLIKPQLMKTPIDSSQYCASKLAYDLFSGVADISDSDWIAVIGIIADSSYETWKRYSDKVMIKYGLKAANNGFDTKLGEICNLMAYYEIYSNGRTQRLFELIYSAKSYRDLFKLKKIIPEGIENEINNYCRNYKDYAAPLNDMMVISLTKSEFAIGAIVSTRLSYLFPNKTIVVMQIINGKLLVNGRRRDFKVAVNDLFEKSIVNLPEASAGGHVPAAGASLRESDYDIFYKNLMENIRKNGEKASKGSAGASG